MSHKIAVVLIVRVLSVEPVIIVLGGQSKISVKIFHVDDIRDLHTWRVLIYQQ